MDGINHSKGKKRCRNSCTDASIDAQLQQQSLSSLHTSSTGATRKNRYSYNEKNISTGVGVTKGENPSTESINHFSYSSYARLHLRPNCRVSSHHGRGGPPLWIELTKCSVQLGRLKSTVDENSQEQTVLVIAPLSPLLISRKHVLLKHYCSPPPFECPRTSVCGGGWKAIDGDGSTTRSNSGFTVDGLPYGGTQSNQATPPAAANCKETVDIPSTWLRNGSTIRIGPSLDPPQLEYIFVAPPGAACPEGTKACRAMNRTTGDPFASYSNSLLQGEVLKCVICSELLMLPTALGCGHIFCKPCIDIWFCSKQFWCPLCRSPLSQTPSRLYGLDSAIESLSLGGTRGVELKDRRQEYEASLSSRMKETELLKEKVALLESKILGGSLSRQNNKRITTLFLDIRNDWSIVQRRKFAQQISKCHFGPPREYMCFLVGLTDDFISTASSEELHQAMNNLFLQPGGNGETGQHVISRARLRLKLFMTYS